MSNIINYKVQKKKEEIKRNEYKLYKSMVLLGTRFINKCT